MSRKDLTLVIAIVLLAVVAAAIHNAFSPNQIDWVKSWPPYSSMAAEDEESDHPDKAPESEPEDQDPLVERSLVEQMIVENMGITDINLATARRIHQYGNGLTFWIDARDPGLYEKGHIKGAHLLDFYQQSQYLEAVEAAIAETQPVALVLYCKGKDCHDSHFLAEDMAAMGYGNIFVYRDGFNDWLKAGLPIEGTLAAKVDSDAESEQDAKAALLDEKPPGMYLEHIIRDMAPFLFGLFLVLAWARVRDRNAVIWIAVIVLGGFFIYAGVPKIMNPLSFAKSIWNYDISPGPLVNPGALIMPWLEVIAGLSLFAVATRRGGNMVIGGLLVIFCLAVSFNMLRGHEFNCGCTPDATLITDLYLEGWNSKVMLLLRDAGLLVMAWLAFRSGRKQASDG